MNINTHSIEDYDMILARIQQEINENPEKQFRILLKALKSIDCPYLRRKLRKEFSL